MGHVWEHLTGLFRRLETRIKVCVEGDSVGTQITPCTVTLVDLPLGFPPETTRTTKSGWV